MYMSSNLYHFVFSFDVHTAYLMGLADALIELKEELPGTIKIIHQHAEEKPPGGAKAIVESL